MNEIVVQTDGKVVVDEREVKIVQMLADGERATTIAPKLKLSNRTVEYIINRIEEKTKTKTHAELVAKFFREKIIS